MSSRQPLLAFLACIHALLGIAMRPERHDRVEKKGEVGQGPTWLYGKPGMCTCPMGYELVPDEKHCKTGWSQLEAEGANLKWGGSFSSDSLPAGCEAYEGHVQFNRHSGSKKLINPDYSKSKHVICWIRDDRLKAADDTFVLTDVGSADCPPGHKEILDETDCEAAHKTASEWMDPSLAKKLNGFHPISWTTAPRGCIFFDCGEAVIFNSESNTVKSHDMVARICMKGVPDRNGDNCGGPCKQWQRKGGVCDWCGLHEGQEQHCCRRGYSDPGCDQAVGADWWHHSCVTVSERVVETMSVEQPFGSGSTRQLLTFASVVIVGFICGLA